MRLASRTLANWTAAACAAAALAGCGTAAPRPAAAAQARGVAAVEPAADPKPFGAADTGFGLSVLRAWCARSPGQNLVFSPSTLASALGMAYLGAKGPTAAAMAKVLGLPADGGAVLPAGLAAGLQARSRALSGLNGTGVTLAASNQVWADPKLPPRGSYLNAVATGYGADLAQAPLLTDPASAAAEINRAITAQTRGHITGLVNPASLQGIGWVLTSALYLDAKWVSPLAAGTNAFTPAGGKPASVPFLDGDGFRYAAAGGWQAAALPYQGGKLTMTALLPPPSATGCALPSQAALASITASLAAGGAGSADVAMPKVSLRTSGDMRQVLTQLGMGAAFAPSADFADLSPSAGPIGFVQQAATLQVDRLGTVGSAAVAVGIASAARAVPPRQLVFDRPYVLLVSAKATGEPLFLAQVANPAAG